MYSEQASDDRGTGTPLILLHSSMSDRTQWRKLGEQLLSHYRVIAIDLYGYGKSEYPPAPECFTLAEEAQRVATIIRQRLGDRRFHLIGHSYGGATALRLTHEQPSSVLSLGLYEPVAFHLLEDDDPAHRIIRQVAERVAECLAAGNTAAATAHFIDFWSGPGTYQGLPAERQQMLDRYIAKVSLDFQALLREPLRAADYRNLTAPVCLLRSRESPLPTRRIAEILEQTLPRLESHWVGGGHMAPISNAEEVNPHWIDFLDRIRE
jgi:pimeloyl-ACP methyl ester carboxylesterase